MGFIKAEHVDVDFYFNDQLNCNSGANDLKLQEQIEKVKSVCFVCTIKEN